MKPDWHFVIDVGTILNKQQAWQLNWKLIVWSYTYYNLPEETKIHDAEFDREYRKLLAYEDVAGILHHKSATQIVQPSKLHYEVAKEKLKKGSE